MYSLFEFLSRMLKTIDTGTGLLVELSENVVNIKWMNVLKDSLIPHEL